MSSWPSSKRLEPTRLRRALRIDRPPSATAARARAPWRVVFTAASLDEHMQAASEGEREREREILACSAVAAAAGAVGFAAAACAARLPRGR